MFAGISSGFVNEDVGSDKKEKDAPPSTPTPPPQRRLAKSFSVAPSAVSKGISFISTIAYLKKPEATLIAFQFTLNFLSSPFFFFSSGKW